MKVSAAAAGALCGPGPGGGSAFYRFERQIRGALFCPAFQDRLAAK